MQARIDQHFLDRSNRAAFPPETDPVGHFRKCSPAAPCRRLQSKLESSRRCYPPAHHRAVLASSSARPPPEAIPQATLAYSLMLRPTPRPTQGKSDAGQSLISPLYWFPVV